MLTMAQPLAFFEMPSLGMWVIIAIFGVLLFGKRLPEVGRSLGKGIVEFKKGLKGLEDEVDATSGSGAGRGRPPGRGAPAAAAADRHPGPEVRDTADRGPGQPGLTRTAAGA